MKNIHMVSGNHYGKSVIMKSLYYTLGAEVYFPNPIKSLNYMTILRFTLEGKEYVVGRLKSMFVVFRNGEFLKKYHNVGDFGDFLSDLFEFEIELVGKDAEGTIEKCPPAFFYLPYYIDQSSLQHREAIAILKVVGNSQEARLKKERLHRKL